MSSTANLTESVNNSVAAFPLLDKVIRDLTEQEVNRRAALIIQAYKLLNQNRDAVQLIRKSATTYSEPDYMNCRTPSVQYTAEQVKKIEELDTSFNTLDSVLSLVMQTPNGIAFEELEKAIRAYTGVPTSNFNYIPIMSCPPIRS